MKKHQIRMFSIRIIEFENKKKDRTTKNFKHQSNERKRKKKIETIKKKLKKKDFCERKKR